MCAYRHNHFSPGQLKQVVTSLCSKLSRSDAEFSSSLRRRRDLSECSLSFWAVTYHRHISVQTVFVSPGCGGGQALDLLAILWMAPRQAIHEPAVVAFASWRSDAMRFCSVRRLIPSISAASLRLPCT